MFAQTVYYNTPSVKKNEKKVNSPPQATYTVADNWQLAQDRALLDQWRKSGHAWFRPYEKRESQAAQRLNIARKAQLEIEKQEAARLEVIKQEAARLEQAKQEAARLAREEEEKKKKAERAQQIKEEITVIHDLLNRFEELEQEIQSKDGIDQNDKKKLDEIEAALKKTRLNLLNTNLSLAPGAGFTPDTIESIVTLVKNTIKEIEKLKRTPIINTFQETEWSPLPSPKASEKIIPWSSILPLSGLTSSISKGIAKPIPPVPAVINPPVPAMINPPGPVPPTPAPKVDWYRNHGEPRTRGKVTCDEGKKTWYHHQQYCACTYNDFADLINDDIQSNRNPLDRVQACIDARIYERDTVFRGRGNQSHQAAIQKMEQLRDGIQKVGNDIQNYQVRVGDNTVGPGLQFYLEKIIVLTGQRRHGGKRRSTRKTNRKQRKQTRRNRSH